MFYMLNQTAILQEPGQMNEYGKITFTEKEVKCRYEEKLVRTINTKGEEVVSNTTVYLYPIDISYSHKINGQEIVSINKITDYRGRVAFVEVVLK